MLSRSASVRVRVCSGEVMRLLGGEGMLRERKRRACLEGEDRIGWLVIKEHI